MSTLRPAIVLFFFFSVLTGLVYPALVTGVAQVTMPWQANGSLVVRDGNPIGSVHIGQSFASPGSFWGRPSVTAYDASTSGGSNLGSTNEAWLEAVHARVDALHEVDPENDAPIPVDLVTASASGLDPDLSIAGALYQVRRIARVRALPEETVRSLVQAHADRPLFGIVGEPHVNVLALNLALDALPGPSSRGR